MNCELDLLLLSNNGTIIEPEKMAEVQQKYNERMKLSAAKNSYVKKKY